MTPLEIILSCIIAALLGAAVMHRLSYHRGLRHGEERGWRKARNQMRAMFADGYRKLAAQADDVPPPSNSFFANLRATRRPVAPQAQASN